MQESEKIESGIGWIRYKPVLLAMARRTAMQQELMRYGSALGKYCRKSAILSNNRILGISQLN